MSALTVSPAYTALLARVPPRVIRTEEQNEYFIAALYEWKSVPHGGTRPRQRWPTC